MKDFSLKDRTILLTVAGSRAYGMHTSESDLDIKGVFVPPLQYYFGMKSIQQMEGQEWISDFETFLSEHLKKVKSENGMEGTIFEVRRFLDLASGANPNILDILFSREEDVIIQNSAGKLLRKERKKFLTKKCLQTFLGYAISQAKRIETHRKWLLNPLLQEPNREEFGLPKRDAYPQDQVVAAMAAIRKQIDRWNIDFVDVDESTKIFIQDQIQKNLAEIKVGSEEKFKAAGNLLGFETNFMDLVHKQRQYSQAVENWSSYQAWLKNRNKKRKGMEEKIGYDCKHGAHLYRLTVACKSIFETGDLQVYNPDPYLMKIRNGEVPFEELMEKFEIQRKDLSEIAAKSNLPQRVDSKWIEDISIQIIKEANKEEM